MRSKQFLRCAGVTLFSHKNQQLKFLLHGFFFSKLFLMRYLLVFSLISAILVIIYGNGSQLHARTLIYTIEEGDTLESIAQRFKISVAALVRINRFRSMEQAQKNVVRGESILIPASDIVFASVGEQGIETALGPEIKIAQAATQTVVQAGPPVIQSATENGSPSELREPEGEFEDLLPPIINREVEKEVSYLGDNGESLEYTVQAGDTLSFLAVRFKSSSARIRGFNSLSSDNIRAGQVLNIPGENFTTPDIQNISLQAAPRTGEEVDYTVEKGDTLLGISRKTKVSIGVIRALNQLEADHILPGQVLRISSYELAVRAIAENSQGRQDPDESAGNTYSVEKDDTLSSISRQFDVSLSRLLEWNNIFNANSLLIGQQLMVAPPNRAGSPSSKYIKHTVEKGNTLWSIARRFGLSLVQLRSYNPDLGAVLLPGQTLKVGETEGRIAQNSASGEFSTSALPSVYKSKEEEISEARANEEEAAYQQLEARRRQKVSVAPPASLPQVPEDENRPVPLKSYFTSAAPRVPRQPNVSYYEEFTDDPLENYQTARKMLAKFDKKIKAMPRISDELAGYAILIDPGHGGLDPGFNSQSQDGSGNPLYIIEDEYNYDYALRLYRQLKRNGANVGLTILSPNHLIIDSPDASRTLVSQKNEIYNSPFINQRGEYRSWPIGTPSGLQKRVKVAESFFNGSTPKSKRIFISLHNDNSPWDKDGRLVLYYKDSLNIDKLGQQMAEFLVPHLGKNAHMRGQNLAVLRRNPARYAILVELRNIGHSRNSWAIRNADLRQEDTEMLTNGILRFVQSLNK